MLTFSISIPSWGNEATGQIITSPKVLNKTSGKNPKCLNASAQKTHELKNSFSSTTAAQLVGTVLQCVDVWTVTSPIAFWEL